MRTMFRPLRASCGGIQSFIQQLHEYVLCADCVLQSVVSAVAAEVSNREEQKPALQQQAFWEKSIPGRWNSRCKGPCTKAGSLEDSLESSER